MTNTPLSGEELKAAVEIVRRVRAGELDPRPAAVALGLPYDQDVLMAIIEHAALSTRPAPSGDGLVEALNGGFVTTRSVGNPLADKRSASLVIEWRGEGSIQKMHAFEDTLRKVLGGQS